MAYPFSFVSCSYAMDFVLLCAYIPFFWVPINLKWYADSRPLVSVWRNIAVSSANRIPQKLQIPIATILVGAVILIGTFASPQSADNNYKNRGISLAGLVIFYAILYITSAKRRMIVWQTVLVGVLCQYLLALFVLRTQVGYSIFNFISLLARQTPCRSDS